MLVGLTLISTDECKTSLVSKKEAEEFLRKATEEQAYLEPEPEAEEADELVSTCLIIVLHYNTSQLLINRIL